MWGGGAVAAKPMEETEMKLSRRVVAAFTALATVVAVGGVSPQVAYAQEVRVIVAPPAPRFEIPGARPGPYHVWQAGSWRWGAEGTYGWHPGRWVLPPQGRTVWVHDEWVSYAGSWHLVPGHWTAVGVPVPTVQQRVIVSSAPPADVVEEVGALPVGHAWIRGHYAWDGVRYVWTPGHTMAIPEGRAAWVPGHWYEAGGHWFFANGYWR